jgi:hypothetical protein
MAKCYNGPTPVTPDERTAIWHWAKANGIDQGMPIDKVGDAINAHFFGGVAKPEWISDILSGRKTPFRSVAMNAWKAQYNRRQIVQQAKGMSQQQALGSFAKVANRLWSAPRDLLTFGHSAVLPLTHGGDLAFRPASYATFFKGIFDTYGGTFNPAYHARMMANLERQPLYDTALRSGLDIGPHSHATGEISSVLGKSSARSWDMLGTMRYGLWQKAMDKLVKPGMSQEETLDLGKNMAAWANHATGSGKSIPGLGNVLFGPKLTTSKISRLFGDPAQTIKTIGNWGNATPGEKAVAWQRLSGATQYGVTLASLMGANAGLLAAMHSPQQINWSDPSKSDFLEFKAGGLEGKFPGMHSEIQTLAKIAAAAFVDAQSKVGKTLLRGGSKQAKIAEIAGEYGMGKLAPSIGFVKDVATGQDFMGRPMPWSGDPGKVTKSGFDQRRISWGDYAAKMGPIPLQGPIGYIYHQMTDNGASAKDSSAFVKSLIGWGLSATGFHAQMERAPTPAQQKAAAHQQRTAAQLRGH